MRPKPGHDTLVQSFLLRSCNLLAMLCVLCVSLAFVRCNVNLDASRLTVPAEALQTSATRTTASSCSLPSPSRSVDLHIYAASWFSDTFTD